MQAQSASHIVCNAYSADQEFSLQDLRGDSSPPTAYICPQQQNFTKMLYFNSFLADGSLFARKVNPATLQSMTQNQATATLLDTKNTLFITYTEGVNAIKNKILVHYTLLAMYSGR